MTTKLPHHNIDIQIETSIGDVPEVALQQAAVVTLALHRVTEACEIVLVFADDAALQDLNQRFRGINRPTDVLSFENDTRGLFFNGPAGFPRYLGDIVISVERAQAQADEVSAALSNELQLLIVHGVLHLLGYDHATPDEKAQMWAAQDAVLQHLGINIPLPE